MTTIGEAIAALGVYPRDGEELCVTRIPQGQAADNKPLSAVASASVDKRDIYLASGAFKAGSITGARGRRKENLTRILFVPWDCDLASWYPDPQVDSDALKNWPQTDIDALLPGFVADVTDALRDAGVPIHALLYTGHGVLALTRISDGTDVDGIQAAHKSLAAQINKRVGFNLIDTAATDAGTRVFRIAGSVNGKGVPRTVRTLESSDGAITQAEWMRIAGQRVAASIPMALPIHARKLDERRSQAIVEALRPTWASGNRHNLSLALAAWFGKAGVPEEQAGALIVEIAGDDPEMRNRLQSVRDTYARLRAGAPTRGFYMLRELLPPSIIEFVDGHLATLRMDENPRIKMHGSEVTTAPARRGEAKPLAFSVTTLPEDAWFGWFAEYRELVTNLTVAPDQFHLASALTMASGMLGRRIRTKWGADLFGNLFTALIGPSGSSKKDTAITWALALPQIIYGGVIRAPGYSLSRDVSSAEGIVQMLKQEPNTLLYLTELSVLMSNARRKGTSTILDKLIEAFDSPHVLENLSKLNPNKAENPYLSIIAATQPTRFASQITQDDIDGGFLNRWLIVPGVGRGRMGVPGEIDEAAASALFGRLADAVNSYPTGSTLRLTDAAKRLISEWYGRIQDSTGDDEDYATMRQRAQTIAVKVSLVYAVSDRAQAIDEEHVMPAMALVDWSWENVRTMMADWAVGTDAMIENKIMDALTKRGPMSRRDLRSTCRNRKWSSIDFTRTLDSMLKNETVVYTPALGMIALPENDR